MIQDIVFTLADKFEEYDWDVYYEEQMKMYCVLVNDYEFYTSKTFKKWKMILRKKYPKVRWFCAYKKFEH